MFASAHPRTLYLAGQVRRAIMALSSHVASIGLNP